MYKIYINETPLILCPKEEQPPSELPDELRLPYSGKPKVLLQTVDMMEKTRRFSRVVLYHSHGEALKTHFHSLFQHVSAAGGVVLGPNRQMLTIFRRGFWDLPKGKIDPGELPEEAAIREVEEETGIAGLVVGPLIAMSHHTYREKKKRILKHTWWYLMFAEQTLTPVPQEEEDIEQAEWMSTDEFLQPDRLSYASLRDIVEKGIALT